MTRHLSARSRLTLLYVSLFTVGGAALVLITYLLVAHTLDNTTTGKIPPTIQDAIGKCVVAAKTPGSGHALAQCAALYESGVRAGASAQRSTALTHLLTYSVASLAGVLLLAAVAGWIAAGRILRPVHRLTTAARQASEENLSQRIALQGRATSYASWPTPSTRCSSGSTARSPASGSSSPTQATSFARH